MKEKVDRGRANFDIKNNNSTENGNGSNNGNANNNNKNRRLIYNPKYETPFAREKARYEESTFSHRLLDTNKLTKLREEVATLKSMAPMHTAFLRQRLLSEMENCTESELACASEEIQKIHDEIEPISETVLAELDPLDTMLSQIDVIGQTLERAELIMMGITFAVKILSYIPGIGSVFKLIHNVLGSLLNKVKMISKRAADFIEIVAGKWESMISKVSLALSSVGAISTVGGFGSFASEATQCMKDSVTALMGLDIFSQVEEIVPAVLTYARGLKDGLLTLAEAFASDIWPQIKESMEELWETVSGIMVVLKPLAPLEAILTHVVEIPWIQLPYPIQWIGPSYCQTASEVGYDSYKGTFSWHTCWEETPP